MKGGRKGTKKNSIFFHYTCPSVVNSLHICTCSVRALVHGITECVCVCGVCVSSLFISWKMIYGACLVHIRSIMVVSRSLPRKSVCTSPTRLKNLSGDVEVAGTVRYCLPIRVKSDGCCFHHIRGSVSLVTYWTCMYA